MYYTCTCIMSRTWEYQLIYFKSCQSKYTVLSWAPMHQARVGIHELLSDTCKNRKAIGDDSHFKSFFIYVIFQETWQNLFLVVIVSFLLHNFIVQKNLRISTWQCSLVLLNIVNLLFLQSLAFILCNEIIRIEF